MTGLLAGYGSYRQYRLCGAGICGMLRIVQRS